MFAGGNEVPTSPLNLGGRGEMGLEPTSRGIRERKSCGWTAQIRKYIPIFRVSGNDKNSFINDAGVTSLLENGGLGFLAGMSSAGNVVYRSTEKEVRGVSRLPDVELGRF